MTLYINELSFNNAKIVSSPDNIQLAVTAIHSSNFPDIQSIGVTDPGFEIEITTATSDVNEVLSRLRGSIRNREFTVVRSTDQNLRDNKKIVFIKVSSIRPSRTLGSATHTVITIAGKYVGTQSSHQPNFYINSTQIANDWSKAGYTMVALPVGAYALTETAQPTIADHPIILTPSWATGTDTGTYSASSVARGTIGFNVDFTTMFNKSVRLYDGSGASTGYHITDLDEPITFSGGYATVHQEGWVQLLFNKTAGWVSIRPATTNYTEALRVYPNSGLGFTEMYVLSINDNYIRLSLDSEDEFELFSCKLPSFFPGSRNAFFTGGTVYQGDVSGNSGTYNFTRVKNGPDHAYIGGNRYFNLNNNASGNTVFKSIVSTHTDVQFWFGWEASDVNSDPKFQQMLRRLE